MSARDELASIAKASGLLTPGESYTVADAILAAGYTKPRIITTAEELEGLPVGAVVLDLAEWLFRKQMDARYVAAGSSGLYSLDAIDLPATVLYEPAP